MYAFLNPETKKIVVYDDFLQASLQALLVNQHFVAAFDEDEPYIVELIMQEDENDET